MSQTNVLFLSYDGMTEPLGQSQVLSYLIGLSKEGYSFHIISFEKAHLFKERRDYITQLCNIHNLKWHPHVYTKKPPVISTIRDIIKMKKLAFELQAKHQISLVHCRSYISALVGIKLKRKKNIKFLFDMRGFWADERVEGKIWDIKNPLFNSIYIFFKKKEKQFLSEADYTISLTENGKKEILSWKNSNFQPAPIQVIPCCANLDKFNRENVAIEMQLEIKKKLQISSNTTILGYIGSIGTWYMLPEMMEFYKTFRKKFNSTVFLFISIENETTIKSEAKRLNIPESEIVVQSVLHKDVPDYISIFDYSVFFINPSFSKKASSPVKQGELMAMGIPVICNSGVGDTDLIVQTSNAGIVLSNLTEKAYASIEFNELSFNKSDISNRAKDYFSLENGIKEYTKIYQKLVN